jgi:GT2 family glycosyltransferase
MSSRCNLGVIILNYRAPEITIECLKTLASEALENPEMRCFLVDNASGDDSVSKIQAAIQEHGWSEWIDFRPLDSNLGFAGGNNLIMREMLALSNPPEYILLLNSDTLVHAGCLEGCRKIMDSDPGIGALSCMVRNRDGSVQNVCRKFPTPLRMAVRILSLPWMFPRMFAWANLEDEGWDRTIQSRDVEWIGGAFFMARTRALKRAGIFDEEFFFYGEDCELCFRLRKHGWRIRFDPREEIIHLGGSSSDEKIIRNHTKELYAWRARFLIARKCHGRFAGLIIWAIHRFGYSLRLVCQIIAGRGHSERARELRELIHFVDSAAVSEAKD